ncbi:hypothetical protein GCM10010222_66730 [Streptomyces tanashiensis]|uniref:hypothetical protein n=1 Tax=Streptomyces tanashiensis TaxID=67367 RepID=UPI0016796DC3|nr:hypothetical protein [Streptomyces tanashiensis]GGT15289.1 hypothetical protein GCM10010222_66730 [Streptomyces tanashiensis]
MGAAIDPPDDRIGPALAYVCRRLDYLRGLLGPAQGTGGDPPELQALTAAVTAARRPGVSELQGLLQALHRAVQAAGDQAGVWQASTQRGLHLPGVSVDTPFEPIYVCPLARCAGRRPDQTTVFPLICALTGRQLERTIL